MQTTGLFFMMILSAYTFMVTLSENTVWDDVDTSNSKSISLGQLKISLQQLEILKEHNALMQQQLQLLKETASHANDGNGVWLRLTEYFILSIINCVFLALLYYLRKRIALYVQGIFVKNSVRAFNTRNPGMPRTVDNIESLLELEPLGEPPTIQISK